MKGKYGLYQSTKPIQVDFGAMSQNLVKNLMAIGQAKAQRAAKNRAAQRKQMNKWLEDIDKWKNPEELKGRFLDEASRLSQQYGDEYGELQWKRNMLQSMRSELSSDEMQQLQEINQKVMLYEQIPQHLYGLQREAEERLQTLKEGIKSGELDPGGQNAENIREINRIMGEGKFKFLIEDNSLKVAYLDEDGELKENEDGKAIKQTLPEFRADAFGLGKKFIPNRDPQGLIDEEVEKVGIEKITEEDKETGESRDLFNYKIEEAKGSIRKRIESDPYMLNKIRRNYGLDEEVFEDDEDVVDYFLNTFEKSWGAQLDKNAKFVSGELGGYEKLKENLKADSGKGQRGKVNILDVGKKGEVDGVHGSVDGGEYYSTPVNWTGTAETLGSVRSAFLASGDITNAPIGFEMADEDEIDNLKAGQITSVNTQLQDMRVASVDTYSFYMGEPKEYRIEATTSKGETKDVPWVLSNKNVVNPELIPKLKHKDGTPLSPKERKEIRSKIDKIPVLMATYKSKTESGNMADFVIGVPATEENETFWKKANSKTGEVRAALDINLEEYADMEYDIYDMIDGKEDFPDDDPNDLFVD